MVQYWRLVVKKYNNSFSSSYPAIFIKFETLNANYMKIFNWNIRGEKH